MAWRHMLTEYLTQQNISQSRSPIGQTLRWYLRLLNVPTFASGTSLQVFRGKNIHLITTRGYIRYIVCQCYTVPKQFIHLKKPSLNCFYSNKYNQNLFILSNTFEKFTDNKLKIYTYFHKYSFQSLIFYLLIKLKTTADDCICRLVNIIPFWK